MFGRGCDAGSPDGALPRQPAYPTPIWGADRISGFRCAKCGALLGAEDIARLLLAKQSQLAQFGLMKPPAPEAPTSGPGRALRVVRVEKD